MKNHLIGLLALVTTVYTTEPSQAIVLNVGECAVFNFTFSAAPTPADPAANLFFFRANSSDPAPLSTYYRLFDGDTLLTEFTYFGFLSADGVNFISEDNTFEGFEGQTSYVIDFSSLLDGTIAGRLEYAPYIGEGETYEFDVYDLTLGYQTSTMTLNFYASPTITSVEVVPEPSTYALLALGAVTIGLRLFRRRSIAGV